MSHNLMAPNAMALAMREDPAFRALMGIHGYPTADFGEDSASRMSGFAPSFGYTPTFGYTPAFGYTPTFGEAPGGAPQNGNPPMHVLLECYKQMAQQNADTYKRVKIMEPNKDSTVKVERYCFALNQALVIGTAAAIAAEKSPSASIRPQRISVNAPTVAFCTLSDLSVANVKVILGGSIDGFQWSALGVDQWLDLPTLNTSNTASVNGIYTGFVPPGFAQGFAFPFCVGLTGPAHIAG